MKRRIEGVLLAAGESRRMGFPKPLLHLADGETFLAHTATAMLTVVGRLVIVLGAHRRAVEAAVPADRRISVVENSRYVLGQLSSIKVGIQQVSAMADAALVHLVDHPTVRESTFQQLQDEFESGDKPIVVTRFQNRRGHPVIFGRSIFPELLDASEAVGARMVVNAAPERVGYSDVNDPGVLLDLDTPEDLERAHLPRVPGLKL
ncbi:MAG: nucleotidyltransferase family protein [Deltaproteobacteria bacterium]|nr:nucleotidyltransferase family protein [Deltaproteobacteria bacterium]